MCFNPRYREIKRVVWAESTSGLVAHYGDDLWTGIQLSHFPDGIEFEWKDGNTED